LIEIVLVYYERYAELLKIALGKRSRKPKNALAHPKNAILSAIDSPLESWANRILTGSRKDSGFSLTETQGRNIWRKIIKRSMRISTNEEDSKSKGSNQSSSSPNRKHLGEEKLFHAIEPQV
jgi:hypothetical protein